MTDDKKETTAKAVAFMQMTQEQAEEEYNLSSSILKERIRKAKKEWLKLEMDNEEYSNLKYSNLKLKSKTEENHHKLSSYRDLIKILNNEITDEDLDQTITIYDRIDDEYYPITVEILEVAATDVLDRGHKVLILKKIEDLV